jgi:hypothetical protein
MAKVAFILTIRLVAVTRQVYTKWEYYSMVLAYGSY